MELIARKPCNFGGKKFFIGDKIPDVLVVNPALQEKLGVIAIVKSNNERTSSTETILYTQEQVENMLEEAIEEAVNNTIAEIDQKQAKLEQVESEQSIIPITVKGESNDENEQLIGIFATAEEVQQVFTIMQMNVDDGIKAIAEVKTENVLILLHASDSRKTIKDAAKKQANNLLSSNGIPSNEVKSNIPNREDMKEADA